MRTEYENEEDVPVLVKWLEKVMLDYYDANHGASPKLATRYEDGNLTVRADCGIRGDTRALVKHFMQYFGQQDMAFCSDDIATHLPECYRLSVALPNWHPILVDVVWTKTKGVAMFTFAHWCEFYDEHRAKLRLAARYRRYRAAQTEINRVLADFSREEQKSILDMVVREK